LLKLNSNNRNYYLDILKANGLDLSGGDDDKVIEALEKYEEVLPKSNEHVRLQLDLVKGSHPAFRKKAIIYMKPQVIKGVPSLINDMSDLLVDAEKAKVIGEILTEMNTEMEANMRLAPGDDEEEQDPTVQLWLHYYRCQHQLKLGNVGAAYELVQKGIAHTPTVIDLYTLKAKVLQLAGNRRQASVLAEEARKLDLADRHLNAHSSKYLLKVDEVEQAHTTMGMFSRETDNGKINVHEMQTMWFEHQCGLAYFRRGELREALKQFHFIELHLTAMSDDCDEF